METTCVNLKTYLVRMPTECDEIMLISFRSKWGRLTCCYWTRWSLNRILVYAWKDTGVKITFKDLAKNVSLKIIEPFLFSKLMKDDFQIIKCVAVKIILLIWQQYFDQVCRSIFPVATVNSLHRFVPKSWCNQLALFYYITRKYPESTSAAHRRCWSYKFVISSLKQTLKYGYNTLCHFNIMEINKISTGDFKNHVSHCFYATITLSLCWMWPVSKATWPQYDSKPWISYKKDC